MYVFLECRYDIELIEISTTEKKQTTTQHYKHHQHSIILSGQKCSCSNESVYCAQWSHNVIMIPFVEDTHTHTHMKLFKNHRNFFSERNTIWTETATNRQTQARIECSCNQRNSIEVNDNCVSFFLNGHVTMVEVISQWITS